MFPEAPLAFLSLLLDFLAVNELCLYSILLACKIFVAPYKLRLSWFATHECLYNCIFVLPLQVFFNNFHPKKDKAKVLLFWFWEEVQGDASGSGSYSGSGSMPNSHPTSNANCLTIYVLIPHQRINKALRIMIQVITSSSRLYMMHFATSKK